MRLQFIILSPWSVCFFFFNDTATTEIYTLSLHDALPISELAVDKWHELSRQIVGVAADRARVHVLVAAERREAIGENEDRRPHPALVDQSRGALGDVVAETLPRHVRQARARESHQIEQHREAASAATPGT